MEQKGVNCDSCHNIFVNRDVSTVVKIAIRCHKLAKLQWYSTVAMKTLIWKHKLYLKTNQIIKKNITNNDDDYKNF